MPIFLLDVLNDLDNEDNPSPVLAPKRKEGAKEESTPAKVANAAPGRTASASAATSKGKRKAGADDSKPSVPTSSKTVKTEDGKLLKDSGASSTKGAGSPVKANGAPPEAKPSSQVTEEDVKAVLKQAGPIKSLDLVNKFKNRLATKEDIQAFAALLKNISRIHKTDAGNFIVLREKSHASMKDGKLVKDSGAPSTKGPGSPVKANGASPKAKPSSQVTEEDVKAVLKQAGPIKSHDLVNKFKNRLATKEDKQAFAAVLKNISRIHKTDAGNFIVLREK